MANVSMNQRLTVFKTIFTRRLLLNTDKRVLSGVETRLVVLLQMEDRNTARHAVAVTSNFICNHGDAVSAGEETTTQDYDTQTGFLQLLSFCPCVI